MTSFFACEREQRETLVSRRRRAGGLGLRRTNLKLEDAYPFYEQKQDVVHVHLLSELGDHLGRGVVLCWEKRRRAVQLEQQRQLRVGQEDDRTERHTCVSVKRHLELGQQSSEFLVGLSRDISEGQSAMPVFRGGPSPPPRAARSTRCHLAQPADDARARRTTTHLLLALVRARIVCSESTSRRDQVPDASDNLDRGLWPFREEVHLVGRCFHSLFGRVA